MQNKQIGQKVDVLTNSFQVPAWKDEKPAPAPKVEVKKTEPLKPNKGEGLNSATGKKAV